MSELDVAKLISVEQACALIDAAPASPRVARVPLADAAGRVLAEDVLCDRDYPPFDKSLMDGYAVRSADARAGAVLRIAGEIAAGQRPTRRLQAGQAIAIMTGAPLPPNADAVVPVELAQRNGTSITVRDAVTTGQYVMRRGGDRAAGTRVLSRGTVIGATQLAVLATVGVCRPPVFARPTVKLLATGDEIVSVRSRPGPYKIRNANSVMLAGLLRSLGCDLIGEVVVPDDRKRLRSALSRAAVADLVVVTGGMSMGQYDFVPGLLVELGFDLKITKLRIKPGKPFVFGLRTDGKVAIGLPGNPVSAYVCALRLAGRLIRRMQGLPPDLRCITAPLADPLPANGPREFYQPAVWDGTSVRPLKWKGSADVFTLSVADALIVRPENDAPRDKGAAVQLLEIPPC